MPKGGRIYERLTPSKLMNVRQMAYGVAGKARRRAAPLARAIVARAAHAQAYREADALANLAVRGLQLAPGELKSLDATGTGGVSSTGTISLLNGVPRGDDIDERVGRQITMKSIEFHLIAQHKAPEAGLIPATFRALIVYDRQTNGAALTVEQVLDSAAPGITRTIVPKNLENRDRFLILRDMKFGLAASVATDFMSAPKVAKVYQGVTLPVTFNAGDAGTVADITTGSLYLILLSDQAVGDAHLPVATWASRIRFSDN